MSRQRKSKRNVEQSAPSHSVNQETTADESPAFSMGNRQQFVLAIALAAIWWTFLIGLAAFTANPVTLNREQIRQADIVISANVTHAERDEALVDKVWHGQLETVKVTIDGLSETGARNGRAYLIPLNRVGAGRLKIAQARFFDSNAVHSPQPAVRVGPALIYRRTDSSVAQLESLLSELKDR